MSDDGWTDVYTGHEDAVREAARGLADSVEQIVVPRVLWERTIKVVERIYNSRRGSCGAIENVYCPPMMNRHGIDGLMNEIRRHAERTRCQVNCSG